MAKNLGGDTDQEELEHYETERVPADVFLWGGCRYSNDRDALAAEKCGGKR